MEKDELALCPSCTEEDREVMCRICGALDPNPPGHMPLAFAVEYRLLDPYADGMGEDEEWENAVLDLLTRHGLELDPDWVEREEELYG